EDGIRVRNVTGVQTCDLPIWGRRVHVFDMDQTKPLFRARDCEAQLEREGVVFHFQAQYLDAPTVASGVIETLRDEDSAVIMDIEIGRASCREGGQAGASRREA